MKKLRGNTHPYQHLKPADGSPEFSHFALQKGWLEKGGIACRVVWVTLEHPSQVKEAL